MWFKVDDGFTEHEKTVEAARLLDGPYAHARIIAVWMDAALYAARRLTDGYVPERVVARCLVDDDPLTVASALVAAGLWIAVPNGFLFHDWDVYQPDAATTKAKRDEDRDRKRRKRTATSDAPLLDADQDQDAIGTDDDVRADSARNPDGIRADNAALARARDPVPVPVLQTKQKSSATARLASVSRPPPARMTVSVFEVNRHVQAAVHRTLDLGPPFVDQDGAPVLAELRAEVKTIVTRDLRATWSGRELDAIIDGALARRRRLQDADRARTAFRRRERETYAAL